MTTADRVLCALPHGVWRPLLWVVGRAGLEPKPGISAAWELIRTRRILARSTGRKGDWSLGVVVVRRPRAARRAP